MARAHDYIVSSMRHLRVRVYMFSRSGVALGRKILLGEISMASGSIDWTGATMDQLGQPTPDQSGHLRTLDSRSWAQELSAVVLGRPDHAVLLSMWACLWSSLTSSGVTLTQARKLFDENDATETIRAFAIDHGVAPHPLTLVRQLQNKGPSWEIDYVRTWPRPRHMLRTTFLSRSGRLLQVQ